MDTAEIKDLLLKVAFNGDQLAFKKIYFFYYSKLKQLAKSFCHSSEAAEEVVDDVFIKMWQNRINLAGVNNLSVYLYVSIKNQSLNYLNKTAKIKYTDISEVPITFGDMASSADQNIMLSDLSAIINKAINRLPPQCRLVFKLVKEDGLKHHEVAQILGISVKTVEYHIGNALKRIALAITEAGSPYVAGKFRNIFSN